MSNTLRRGMACAARRRSLGANRRKAQVDEPEGRVALLPEERTKESGVFSEEAGVWESHAKRLSEWEHVSGMWFWNGRTGVRNGVIVRC